MYLITYSEINFRELFRFRQFIKIDRRELRVEAQLISDLSCIDLGEKKSLVLPWKMYNIDCACVVYQVLRFLFFNKIKLIKSNKIS